MNWKIASWVALALWGSYCIFGEKANKIHGTRITMAAEALAMLIVTFVALSGGGLMADLHKVTPKSVVFALTMGLMSAGGLYLQLVAFKNAPKPSDLPVIAMITGFWPVVTVALTALLGARLSWQQWVGVIFSTVGLYLVNTPPKS